MLENSCSRSAIMSPSPFPKHDNLAKENDEGMKKVEDMQREDTTTDDSDFCESSEEELQAIEEQIRQSQRSPEQVDCQTTRYRCEANSRGHNVRKGKA
jgi:hypothetical protein